MKNTIVKYQIYVYLINIIYIYKFINAIYVLIYDI